MDAKSLKSLDKLPGRRSIQRFCSEKLLRDDLPASGKKSRKTVHVKVCGCYGKLLRDLPRGVLRRGHKLYYRHTIPVDAQALLNRLEIWRSLRTDSLAVALRRLPRVVAEIETAIEQARAMAGMPVDATLLKPSIDDRMEYRTPTPAASLPIEPVSGATLADAYRAYIDDPTRAWTSNTREAYETSRRLAVAVIGEMTPIASISRAHCRDMLDVLRFLPANAGKMFPKLSLREAADLARDRDDIKIISAANANSLMSNMSSFLN